MQAEFDGPSTLSFTQAGRFPANRVFLSEFFRSKSPFLRFLPETRGFSPKTSECCSDWWEFAK
jgi:hypothetical protein